MRTPQSRGHSETLRRVFTTLTRVLGFTTKVDDWDATQTMLIKQRKNLYNLMANIERFTP